MTRGRLEAFSDGVIAILITIMVLELRAPEGTDWHALAGSLPHLVVYVASFVFLGIYWNNHHHMFHLADHVDGRILWANLHLLFWLSLVPFVTSWVADAVTHPEPVRAATQAPAAAYGFVLLFAALAYTLLARAIIARQGARSRLAAALGHDWKGKVSLVLYAAGILAAFASMPALSYTCYVVVALIWLVPDRRVERALGMGGHAGSSAAHAGDAGT